MTSNLDKYEKDLGMLIREGEQLLALLKGKNSNLLAFREGYEIWYSEALSVVKIVLPDRLVDFCLYYKNKEGDSLKKAITYTPPRHEGVGLKSVRLVIEPESPEQIDYARSLFVNQLAIIKSAKKRFKSSLFDIRQLVQADLFDSELDAARELNKKGFVRGAGAIAGVVLEAHLLQVCNNHNVVVRKKNPGINDFAQLLKDNNVIDTPEWRNIQRLADLRNLCDHKKTAEPKQEDIGELIDGVARISKTLF